MNIIQQLEKEQVAIVAAKRGVPVFGAGDTVIVNVKVVEGERTRVQAYEGVCIARSGGGINENFTVRKMSYGEGVERVFPVYSPLIDSIKVVRRGEVRRAKLYYLRDRTGKSARIVERRASEFEDQVDMEVAASTAVSAAANAEIKAKAKAEAKARCPPQFRQTLERSGATSYMKVNLSGDEAANIRQRVSFPGVIFVWTFGKERDWMFETLSDRLSGIFDKLTGRGALSEADVDVAMREVRRALLEADVALEVVRTFIDKVKERAVGAEIVKSIKPGQMVVKIVHDVLVETLGSRPVRPQPPRRTARCHSHGGPAGLRQNHHHRQDRQAPAGAREAQGPDGLPRYKPPRRPGTARHPRPAGEGRHLGHRQGRDANPDRQARHGGSPHRRLTTW